MMIDFHTHAPLADRYADRDDVCVVQSMMPGDTIDPRADGITYGIHPLSAEAPKWVEAYKADPMAAEALLLDRLEALTADSVPQKLIGVGECGWDKRSEVLSMADQTLLFRLHEHVAVRLGLPLILHVVGGWHLVLSERKRSSTGAWYVHGFRGKPTLLQQLLDADIRVSMSPAYDRRLIPPLTSFFLETDESPVSIDEQYRKVAQSLRMSCAELETALMCHFNAL